MVMFKFGILALSSLVAFSSPSTPIVENATHDTTQDIYYYNSLNSSVFIDSENYVFNYKLNRSWYIELNDSNSTYELTSTEDKPFFYDNIDYVNTGVFFAYNGKNDFHVNNNVLNNVLDQQVIYSTSYDYLILQKTFNNGDNNGHLYSEDNYFMSFDCYSNIPNLLLTYTIDYARSYNQYKDNIKSYGGVIRIDNNNSFNIPFDTGAGYPNFVDYQYLEINLTFTSTASYSAGYNAGYNEGFTTGSNNGYSVGYDAGYIQGTNADTSFARLIFSIADTPIYYLRALFSIELFGINVFAVITSMVTAMVILWVVKKFVL